MIYERVLVGAESYRLSTVDAHTVALKPVSTYDIVLWHFGTCTSVNCLTCVVVMTIDLNILD